MHKSELRRQIRDLKRQFTPQQLGELSLEVVARLRPRLAEAQVIMAYYSLPDEVCTHQLLNELAGTGKMVLLPGVLDDNKMELRCYSSPEDLREGAFHIMEPVGAPFTDLRRIDVALVPGVAFDALGHRLGRGKGYYDRFLSRLSCRRIGICFDFQKVAEVPVGEHDISVDEVI